GRAFHQQFEIGCEGRCRTQQCDENSTNNGRETNAEHDTLLYTRKGLVTWFAPVSWLASCDMRREQRRGLPVSTVAYPPKTRLQLRGSAGFTPASQFRRGDDGTRGKQIGKDKNQPN